MSGAPRLEETLTLVGLSHFTAPVTLRERLAFRAADLPRALGAVRARGFLEAAILSTCNRVEVLTVARADSANPVAQVRACLSEYHSVPEPEFAGALYTHAGTAAAQHLFEVTASLDSQVLGETEILAQAKEAFRIAAETGTCGHVLHRLFERAFFLSKELRADGGIGRAQASVSSAAVALAEKLFEVKHRKVLVVGTGEMAAGIMRGLRAAGAGDIYVASRTAARAEEFAQQEGGHPCAIQQLPEYLVLADIVLVSAAAPSYVIVPSHIKDAAGKRRGRTLCLIDISVPRNIDPAVGELDDTYLYDIDDLESVAAEGRREREQVAARWRPKLAEEARECLRQLSAFSVNDTAQKLVARLDAIREEIFQQARTTGMDETAVAELSRALEKMQGRILHGPLETLRQAGREGDDAEASAWASRFFRLELPAAAKKS